MLWLLAVAVFLLNLPCGFYRVHVPKFSVRWFVAVHAPVPVIVCLRLSTGLGFGVVSFVALVGAYFAGQATGGIIGKKHRRIREGES